MFRRPVLAILLILLSIIVLLAIGAAVAVATLDPRSFLEQRIGKALDRRVSIGALQIGWGNPLKVEVSDFRLGNAPWGSTPDMATVQHLSAEIDAKALLSGQLIYNKLVVVKPVVVLERNPDGIGNWRFGSGLRVDQSTDNTSGGLAVIPKNRRQFPVLFDFALQDATISYRTYAGNVLRIGLDQVKIKSPGQDQLVDIDAVGSYNGSQLSLTAQTQSFNILRDGTSPFGTTFSLKRDSARLDFTGTMMEPLDFEGVHGPMRVKAEKLNDLLGIFNVALDGNPSSEATGDLTKQGNLWNLINAKGQVGGNSFAGNLVLLEGSRGGPDDIKLGLTLDQFDVDPLVTAKGSEGQGKRGGDWMETPLSVPDGTTPKLAAKITANGLKYGGLQVKDFNLDGQLGPQLIRLDQATFTLADAKVRLTGGLEPAKEGGRLTTQMQLEAVDAAKLAGTLGSTNGDIGGKIDGGVELTMQGTTLRNALKASKGDVVLSMKQGRISRDLLEKAATDLRTLFRKGKGDASISCLLGVMRVRNGVGMLDPLRLRSPEATLNGTGRVDLAAQSLDVTLQSDAKSTGLFAMDIPLRISGNWRKPRIEKAGKAPDAQATGKAADLSPALQRLVQQNSCSQ